MPPPEGRRRKILLVDDDPTVLVTYSRMLGLHDFDVHTAMDAERGLLKAFSYRPDAILLDLRMPLADGLAFLRRLREREKPARTPVAIVTGDYLIDEAVTKELNELGAIVHFKPLWLEDLVDVVQRLIP